jgi:phenylpyruvate tautomerase PptA (4-oxalocrotonate tautomerase family)
MPTYTVTVPEGRLSAEQKRRIAAAVTAAHCEVAVAPRYFAQVIFNEVQEGNYFLGGATLDGDHIFVHGQIRAGRSRETKHSLITRLLEDVAEAAAVSRSYTWVYIIDVPPEQMAEFGHVLPEPGKESAWAEALPEPERNRIQAIGTTA